MLQRDAAYSILVEKLLTPDWMFKKKRCKTWSSLFTHTHIEYQFFPYIADLLTPQTKSLHIQKTLLKKDGTLYKEEIQMSEDGSGEGNNAAPQRGKVLCTFTRKDLSNTELVYEFPQNSSVSALYRAHVKVEIQPSG